MARNAKSPATIIRDLQRHTATLHVGDRVWMPADEDEGWQEERGVLVEVDYKKYVVMVRLDHKYWEGAADDGLRETGAEFVRLDHRNRDDRQRPFGGETLEPHRL